MNTVNGKQGSNKDRLTNQNLNTHRTNQRNKRQVRREEKPQGHQVNTIRKSGRREHRQIVTPVCPWSFFDLLHHLFFPRLLSSDVLLSPYLTFSLISSSPHVISSPLTSVFSSSQSSSLYYCMLSVFTSLPFFPLSSFLLSHPLLSSFQMCSMLLILTQPSPHPPLFSHCPSLCLPSLH